MSKKDDVILKLGKDDTCTLEEFQYYVRNMREHLGMSQAEMARYLVVSQTTVKNWEQGKRIPKDPYTTINAIRHLLKRERVKRNEQNYRK